ncbi:MAG: nucleoside triphosphate pyrophosphohydrolase [Dictyoglomi bacterium]|nr:nucleoside triphosphate pyrophosphohydrolase [Dictyoglomota bacterium]
MNKFDIDLLNFSWLEDGVIAGSAKPSLPSHWEYIKQQGIKAIVSLTEKPLDSYALSQMGISPRNYLHLPIKDMSVPEEYQVWEFLEFVWRKRSQGAPVLVHCGAGVGRTGTMLAFYLKSLGYTGERAIMEVRKKRPGSIETPAQEEFVRKIEVEEFWNDAPEPYWYLRIRSIVHILRKECPWDRKLTPQMLVALSQEELIELMNAIAEGDIDEYAGEVGDILLHLLLHVTIAEEKKQFDMVEVIKKETYKMIGRHPHVFALEESDDAAAVLSKWEKWKKKEKKGEEKKKPRPSALIWAFRVQDEAAQYGFDWTRLEDVMDKVEEEVREVWEAIKKNDRKNLREEIGDLLFVAVNLARLAGIDPEGALSYTTEKFRRRFRAMKKLAEERGLDLRDMTLDEMEKLYQEVKKNETG